MSHNVGWTMEHFNHWIMTWWDGEQWDFQNNENTMKHSIHRIVTEWHKQQSGFQNNEKIMEHSDHWIITRWYAEQWDFQYNEKTMEYSDQWITCRILTFSIQWKDNGIFWSVNNMQNTDIFNTMKRQWNISIT